MDINFNELYLDNTGEEVSINRRYPRITSSEKKDYSDKEEKWHRPRNRYAGRSWRANDIFYIRRQQDTGSYYISKLIVVKKPLRKSIKVGTHLVSVL